MQAPVLRIIKEAKKIACRNFGVTATALQNDPIQKLFVEKIREYRQKSQGGKLVEVSPEMQKEFQADLSRLEKQFQISGKDMKAFPTFNFSDPKFDSINVKD